MTVFPETSAAIMPPAGIAYGKFHGDATTTTPLGWESSIVSSADNPYNLAKSMASETSELASTIVFPNL